MDDIKSQRGRYNAGRATHRRPHAAHPLLRKTRHSGELYFVVRTIGKVAVRKRQNTVSRIKNSSFAKWHSQSRWQRIYTLSVLLLFMTSTVATIVQPLLELTPFKIPQQVRSVIPESNERLGQLLTFNTKEAGYMYNEGYSGAVAANKSGNGEPRFRAAYPRDPKKGVTITDPVNQIDFTIKPKFSLGAARQDKNQVAYVLGGAEGYLVYTNQIASVKEDIVLISSKRDRMTFVYELGLGTGLTAKLESDGSVGIYGSELPINGNVATGSEQDAALLDKARQNAPKTKYLFGIPAPTIIESGQTKSNVASHFELEGNKLTVVAEGLKKANYPLSIDPSIFIDSAAQLMRGNNESNVEFDVANELFKKGSTTGARIDEWTETGTMASAVYDQGVVASGGYIYRAGGRTGRIMPWVASTTKTALATAGTSFAMDMPAVRPSGDLYLAVVARDGTGTITAPVGGTWTLISNTTRELQVFCRVGGASEPATYTWTNSASVQWVGAILRIKNSNASCTSGTGYTSAVQSNAADANPTFPAVTPTSNGALILRSTGWDDDFVDEHGYGACVSTCANAADFTHDDIASGNSGGANGVGFAVSRLDSPQLSGVSAGSVIMPPSEVISDSYGASSIAIYGNAATPGYSSTVEWAHFSSTDRSIDLPNPGTGTCSNWCNDSAYNLPTDTSVTTNGAGLVGAQMVAYNGYLYVIGGYDGTQLKSTVYVAKLGVNGEPQKWHPSDSNQANWVYWYKDTTGLSSARAYTAAFAYNGRLYLMGGRTSMTSTPAALSTSQYTDLLPNGTLGSWSSGPTLPDSTNGRYGMSVQGYNGYLYLMGGQGGANGTTVSSSIHYIRLNANGSMNSWQAGLVDGTSTMPTAKTSMGGVMSGIWGGYLYIAGGCTTVNTTASGYCSAIDPTVNIASINADGSLDTWNTMANLRNTRFGSSFIAWQGGLYRFGGCSRQDTTSGDCYAAHLDVQYGSINQDGDASTVSISTADGTGLCVDPDPYNCNLPPGGNAAGQIGQALSGAAIMNGYLYVMGGCTTAACGTMSDNTAYAAIDSTGRLKRPPTCSTTAVGAWCIDDVNVITGGIGAPGVTVFGGFIYLVGGQNGANGTTNIFRNSVNADGSLTGGWTPTTFTAAGLTAYNANGLSYTYAYARANPSGAGSNAPGNLYIFGGCSNPAGNAGCTSGNNYSQSVYKCTIQTAGAISGCATTGQEPIGSPTGATNPGLGIHAGTVYANYIYLIGGVSDGAADLPYVRYAKFDNNNNVIGVNGANTGWIESTVEMNRGRRRGTAFGYNGYLYAVGGFDASTSSVLDTVEFVKVNVSDGSLVSSIPKAGSPGRYLFTQSAVTINQRWGLSLAVSNSFAYIIGGCKVGVSPSCTTLDDTIQIFQVYNNNSGAPGGYTTSANLYGTDTNRIGASSAVYNGYLYIAGGCTSTDDCSGSTANVSYAPIDANGAVGTWTSATGTGLLPAARAWGQLEVAGGSLYYIGGQSTNEASAVSTVYYTSSLTSGVPVWATASNVLPAARTQLSATVWNNRIYAAGGSNGTTAQNTVYVSPQLNSGGDIGSSWTSLTGFNVARSGLTAITYANNLYILGGYDGTNYLSDVQFAQIASNGTLGSWTYSTSLPRGTRQADGFASNGYMYLFGGRSSTNECISRTLIAPISANTTIATGNNPTGIGEWYQTNRNFDGGRYGATASLYQGKAYIMGGGCQGIVMQDNFDSGISGTEWSATPNMAADTDCIAASTTNTMNSTTGGAGTYAATKDVNVTSGGTIFFKLYIPLADSGTCYRGEQTFSLLTPVPDFVQLQYSTDGLWTPVDANSAVQIGGNYAYNGQDPINTYAVSIPAGAQTANTRFRWIMPNGAATDTFALEDVFIVANGSTSISYATDTRVTQTALLSQPQIASYSRLIDAGKDVTPTVWLMNGIDNSIGARWQLNYRSMNDTTNVTSPCGGSVMSTFGQTYNYGDVTLTTPGPYTVRDGSGANIGCGRYFFMTISIDASQTYGYPEDVARGPTLDNLALFFTSSPAQRLIHGKTFLEGIQQPLDTPCRQSGGANNVNCPLP